MKIFTSTDIMIDEEYEKSITFSHVQMELGWFMRVFVRMGRLDSVENDTKVMVF
jgi:hypothetical protein